MERADRSAPADWQSSTLQADDGESLADLARVLAARWRLLVGGTLLAGLVGLGASYLMAPVFTATTTFLPPQQAQSSAANALAMLGPLAGLAGSGAGLRTPADQYVALMQSATVSDSIIDQFKLIEAYQAKFRIDARNDLAEKVRISVGKKDGLVTVQVDDTEPARAAAIANRYVDELRKISSTFAITEAQQRRAFFEREMVATRDRLTKAQLALASSGFNQGALKAEPKAAAEGYARLRAEITAAEVRLQTLRGTLVDNTPEVRQQIDQLSALRSQMARVEQSGEGSGGPDYVSKYREFKYQETLFELFARQYEMARVDESREGALIQVVDVATPPEKKSRPRRSVIALLSALAAGAVLASYALLRRPAA
jgi:uncharacterized protein involved in exopolysaccharide biosynthesis